MLIKDILTEDYAKLDAAIAHHLRNEPVSCKKSCAYCCNLCVLTTVADAINIAETLTMSSDWKVIAIRLHAAAKKMTEPGMDDKKWFELKIPCIFLNPSTQACDIYPVRPAECRFYLVASPPEDCNIIDKKIGHYNLFKAQNTTWVLSEQIQKEHPWIVGPPPLTFAPLSLMILYAMKSLLNKDKKHRKFFTKLLADLPTPKNYTQNRMHQMAKRFNLTDRELSVKADNLLKNMEII